MFLNKYYFHNKTCSWTLNDLRTYSTYNIYLPRFRSSSVAQYYRCATEMLRNHTHRKCQHFFYKSKMHKSTSAKALNISSRRTLDAFIDLYSKWDFESLFNLLHLTLSLMLWQKGSN